MRTLVVEDSAIAARLLEYTLRDRGHDVESCADAERAWAACQAGTFQLVLTDWMLPGMDGLELTRRIRGLAWGQDAVIVVITAQDRTEDMLAALDAGASDYLPKPFTPQLLQIRLAVAERRAAGVAARRAAEDALIEARAAAAESAAWRELSRQQQLMINVIAHEMRTPLAMIFGFSELLIERDLPPERLRVQLEAIHQGATRLNNLVSAIVELSLLESREVTMDSHRLELGSLIQQWTADLATPRLTVSIAPDLPPVQGDERRLHMAVDQLVRNALTNSPPEAPVRVTVLKQAEDAITVEVTDEGVGIPPEDTERIFDPLFRTDPAHDQAKPGAGIGLALVRRIAEIHGGHVSVESTPGRGSTFRLVLPTASEG